MGLLEIVFASLALSADAFTASMCKGMANKKISNKDVIKIGLWFGIFHGVFAYIGFLCGISFEILIKNYDHWIAFILLSFIGIDMIIRAKKDENKIEEGSINFKSMFLIVLATSIDVLAFGVAYECAYGSYNSSFCFISIGAIVTFISSLGFTIGNEVGVKYKKTAKIIGGIILILLGTKILVEHLI